MGNEKEGIGDAGARRPPWRLPGIIALWALIFFSFAYSLGVLYIVATTPADGQYGVPAGPDFYRIVFATDPRLLPGDAVLKIDGLAYERWVMENWFPRQTLHHPDGGVAHTFTVEREGQVFDLHIPFQRLGWLEAVKRLAPLDIVGGAFLLAAMIILLRRPDELAARILCLGLASSALTIYGSEITQFGVYLDWSLYWPDVWGIRLPLYVATAALAHAYLLFPERRTPLQKRPWLALILYLPHPVGYALAFLLPGATPTGGASASLSVMYFFSGLLLLLGMGSLARTYFKPTTPLAAKNQLRWIVWGHAVGLSPFLLFFVLPSLLVGYPLIPIHLAVIPTAAIPIGITFAILRYRLWDIDLIINRSLVYGVLSVVLVAGYLLLVGLFTRAFVLLSGEENSSTAVFFTTASLAVAFAPARNAIQRVIDRAFYRNRIDLRAAQRDLGRALSSTVLLDNIIQVLTRDVPQMLQLQRAAVWLSDGSDLSPYPAGNALSIEEATLVMPLGRRGVYAIGESLAGRPLNQEETHLLVTLGDQAAIALENAHLAAQLAARARAEEELSIARRTQLSLLPSTPPQLAGWDIAGFSQPATEVGGDFYFYHSLPDGGLGVAVGDVSGKGMPAALLMGGSMITLSALASEDPPPAELLRRLDQVMQPYRDNTGHNTAMCYLRIAPADGRTPTVVRTANAGMIAPLVRRLDGRIEWLDVYGLPLGSSRYGTRYPEVVAEIMPGEIIVVASDGVVEHMSSSRELFGFERFEQVITSCDPQLSAAEIRRAIIAQVGSYAPLNAAQDDMTLVVMRVVANSQ
jgi:serine phosphatase RsbU (regulator of sigma subunit)